MKAKSLQEIVAAIDTEHVVDIAKRLCRIPSPVGDEGKLGELVASLLDLPGVKPYLQYVVPGRCNVLARVRGRDLAPPLLLVAHLDSSVAEGWTRDPYQPWVDDGRLYGGAITDMKGGLAAVIAAVQAAAQLDPPPGDLVLLAAMGHSPTGLGTKFALASEGPWSGYGIFAQSSSLGIHTANGGVVKFEIVLTGRTAHLASKENAIDALAAAMEVYRAVQSMGFTHIPNERLPDLPCLLIGELHAGTNPTEVADRAVIRGDVRTVPGMDRNTVRQDLEAILTRACPPKVHFRINIIAAQKPFIGLMSSPLIDALGDAHRLVRGVSPQFISGLPSEAWVIDAVDMEEHGISTIMYGPAPWRYIPDEWIDIAELADAARVYLVTAMTLGTET